MKIVIINFEAGWVVFSEDPAICRDSLSLWALRLIYLRGDVVKIIYCLRTAHGTRINGDEIF